MQILFSSLGVNLDTSARLKLRKSREHPLELGWHIIIIIIIITSKSDLQPSTPTANQLPGQLVSTEIRTTYV